MSSFANFQIPSVPTLIVSASSIILFTEYIATRQQYPYKPSLALNFVRTKSEQAWNFLGVLVARLGSFPNLLDVTVLKRELKFLIDAGSSLASPLIGTALSFRCFLYGYAEQVSKYVKENWSDTLTYAGTLLLGIVLVASGLALRAHWGTLSEAVKSKLAS